MNLAYYHGQKFQWDPAKNDFASGTGEAKWLTREYRGEWRVEKCQSRPAHSRRAALRSKPRLCGRVPRSNAHTLDYPCHNRLAERRRGGELMVAKWRHRRWACAARAMCHACAGSFVRPSRVARAAV